MAEITSTGIAQTGLPEWVTNQQGRYRTVFGNRIEFDPASVQQQQIGIDSEAYEEIDEAIVSVFNGQSLDTAVGYQLDFIGSTVGIERTPATVSVVTLTLTGTAGTVIQGGALVQTAGGMVFVIVNDATIPSTSTIANSQELGAIEADTNTITQIVSIVSGWETVTNAAAATPGRIREPDNTYRARIRRQLGRNSLSSIESIRTAVEEVTGVTKAEVLENPTGVLDADVNGVSIAAMSIYVVALGGTDAAVAEAIYNSKAAGTVTDGAVTENLSRGNWTVPVKFTRPTETPVTATMSIALLPGFPTDGLQRIRQALLGLAGNLNIGEAIYDGDAYVAALSVPGYRIIGAITIARDGGGDAVTMVAGNELFTLASADVTISVP